MAIDQYQLRNHIIRPSLTAIGLYSDSAETLLLLTCAIETELGTYIRQKDVSPGIGAYGIYQSESSAYDHIWDNVILKSPALKAKIRLYIGYDGKPPITRLITDNALATIIARLHYHGINKPLPSASDIPGMAKYYKQYYNGNGKATIAKVIENYKRYVKND